jgi:hypothetical protein
MDGDEALVVGGLDAAGDRELPVVELDLESVGGHAREVDPQIERVVVLANVHVRQVVSLGAGLLVRGLLLRLGRQLGCHHRVLLTGSQCMALMSW